MMKWLGAVGGGVLALVALVLVVGTLLPEDHRATMHRTVPGSPEAVWEVMTDISGLPDWRPGVDEVERLPDRNGMPVWRESGSTGAMTLEATEWIPPRRMVTRIADEELPFGGSWTFELEPAEDGTRVTITEDGEIYNPFFRFMARFVFGYDGTARRYLEGLEARMSGDGGESAA